MGSFLGHVVPGTFFSIFALWWMYNVLHRYFYARRFRPTSYKNVSSFPFPCNGNIPIESIFKVVAVTIGILGEFCTAFDNGKFTHWGNAQHITMFFFFGINGVIDLCMYRRWDLPPKLDYVTAALAFAIEGFLFFYHLHGRPHMDIMVHMFLFYVTMACVVSTLAEMFQPTNVMPALCRVFFTLLQGTWFFQVGFILFPPVGEKWDVEDHTQMMIVTMIFTWHIAAIFFIMFGMGALIYLTIENSAGSLPMYQMVDTNEPLRSDREKDLKKDIYSDGGNANHRDQRNLTNGHVPFDKSDSIHRILDSDSEEA